MHNKKVTSALVLFVVGVLTFTVGFGRFVSSSSLDELQVRIMELKEVVADLKAQQAASQKSGAQFTKDLAYGDEGEDVRRLQVFLNRDPRTRVAENGSGAPGAETTFFGVRTLEAVRRYQELYRTEILDPENLAHATGYVGASTRQHMNNTLQSEAAQADAAENEADENTPDFTEGVPEPEVDPDEVTEVLVSRVGPTRVRPGETIRISGFGFTDTGNDVHFDDVHTSSGLSSSRNVLISVPIPEDMEPGVYNISVSNARGTSGDYNFIIVYEGAYEPPNVSHITPSEGPYGTEITIHGSGFTREGNQIRASYAIIEDVPSPDGKTLTFKVKPDVGDVALEEGDSFDLGLESTFYFFVVNGNGISREPATFVWKM